MSSKNILGAAAGLALAGCAADYSLYSKPDGNAPGVNVVDTVSPVDTGIPIAHSTTEGESPSFLEYFDRCLSSDPCGDSEPACTEAFADARISVEADVDAILEEGGSVVVVDANFYGTSYDDRGVLVYTSSQRTQGLAIVAGKSCAELTPEERLAVGNYAGFLEGVDVPMAVHCGIDRGVRHGGRTVDGGLSWGSGTSAENPETMMGFFTRPVLQNGAPAGYDTTTSHFEKGGEWPRESVRTYAGAFTADEVFDIQNDLDGYREALIMSLGTPSETDRRDTRVDHSHGYYGELVEAFCYPLAPL